MDFSHFKSNKGQGVVEYLLLMCALVAISVAVFKSSIFREFAGNDSAFFKSLTTYMEYTYRFGSPGRKEALVPVTGGRHSLYIDTKNNTTRFFISVEGYPK